MAEFDSPWKESLDVYFESFLQLCFPAVHREIDWLRGYEPLDKEIQKLSPKGGMGPRGADKLMRVWRNSGEEERQMPYVTSIERLALEKGREEGLLEGIKSVLEIRFGEEAAAIMTQFRQLSSAAVLEKVLQAAKTVDRPEDLAALWAVESEESRQDDNGPDA